MVQKLKVETVEVKNIKISNQIYVENKPFIEKQFAVILKRLNLRWIITGDHNNCTLAIQELIRCANDFDKLVVN